jgi:hypothetical protein
MLSSLVFHLAQEIIPCPYSASGVFGVLFE